MEREKEREKYLSYSSSLENEEKMTPEEIFLCEK